MTQLFEVAEANVLRKADVIVTKPTHAIDQRIYRNLHPVAAYIDATVANDRDLWLIFGVYPELKSLHLMVETDEHGTDSDSDDHSDHDDAHPDNGHQINEHDTYSNSGDEPARCYDDDPDLHGDDAQPEM